MESLQVLPQYSVDEIPRSLADELVQYACIRATDRVLDPNARGGQIAKSVNAFFPGMAVDCFGLQYSDREFLMTLPKVIPWLGDFLKYEGDIRFDRIIGNPPCDDNQDIDHVIKMFDLLAPGGRLVSIMSEHWISSSGIKEASFRDFLDRNDGIAFRVTDGAFKSSGTTVVGYVVIIDKPKN